MARQSTFPNLFSLLKTYFFPPPELRAIYELYARLCRATDYLLTVETFGALRHEGPLSASLGYLTKKAATPPLKGTYLYLFTRLQRPQRILELGTHLGLGTLYLHAAAPKATIHTIDASETLATYARRHFNLSGARIHMHIGEFDKILPTLSGPWDIIYIDGDHRGIALEAYIAGLYPHLREGGWFVCDDIYWSRDMWHSWQKLRRSYWKKVHTVYPFGFLQK